MKKHLKVLSIINILCCLIPYGNSQNYEPLVIENAHWVVATSNTELLWNLENFREYFTSGDTIVNQIEYKKVYRYHLEPDVWPIYPPYHRFGSAVLFGLIRDYIDEKLVFGIQLDNPGVECFSITEDTLFDFSLSQYDTIELCQALYGEIPIIDTYYQSWFGYYRRVSEMGSYYWSNYFIEGIGSTYGLFEYMGFTSNNIKQANEVLLCYTINDLSACDIITSITSISESKIKIYPNPVAGNTLCIQIPENSGRNFILVITDVLGKTIYEGLLNAGNNLVNSERLNSGIHMVKIFNDQELLFITKILKL